MNISQIRPLVWLTGLIAAVVGGCCGMNKPDINMPIIDMHTHLFNARDLPLTGILHRFGVPSPTAEALAATLYFWTPKDDDTRSADGDQIVTGPVTDDPRVVAAEIRSRVQMDGVRGPGDSLLPLLAPGEREALFRYAEMDVESPRSDRKSIDELEVLAVARALAKANIPPSETEAGPGNRSLANVSGYVRFVGVVTRGHRSAARKMSRDQYPEVRLFVHHMMDLASAYADVPPLPFDRQMKAMSTLDTAMSGKTIHFVAFDPFRRQDALAFVKRGLANGAIGVKFYPPSGYSAAGNRIGDAPTGPADEVKRWQSRYGGTDPLTDDRLDTLVEELFTYCEANDIPIFTHCTTEGFEAVPGYGAKSDPNYWAAALAKHPKLRLCFGHSGGHAFWFARTGTEVDKSFGARVVELCLEYPNVYCEAGYLEQILDPKEVARFQARLAEVIERSSPDGQWKFGNKIMYGTDWFMIAKERHPETYLHDFWKAFATPVLQSWRPEFFAKNAVTYLKLRELAEQTGLGFSLAQKQYWMDLIKDIDGSK